MISLGGNPRPLEWVIAAMKSQRGWYKKLTTVDPMAPIAEGMKFGVQGLKMERVKAWEEKGVVGIKSKSR